MNSLFGNIKFVVKNENHRNIVELETSESSGSLSWISEAFNKSSDSINMLLNSDGFKDVSIVSIKYLEYIELDNLKNIISNDFLKDQQSNPYLEAHSYIGRKYSNLILQLYSLLSGYRGDTFFSNFGDEIAITKQNFVKRKILPMSDNLLLIADDQIYRINYYPILLNGFNGNDLNFAGDYLISLARFLKYDLIDYLKNYNDRIIENNPRGKININGSRQLIGYLFNELILKGYIEPIRFSNGSINKAATAQMFLDHFEFTDKPEQPSKDYFNDALFNNSLGIANTEYLQQKLEIPNVKQFK